MPMEQGPPGPDPEGMLIADVYASCVTAANDAFTKAQAGQASKQMMIRVGHCMLDNIRDAAAEGHVAQVESYIDTMLTVRGMPPPVMAEACLMGTKIRSQHAFEVLASILQGERYAVAQEFERNPAAFKRFPVESYEPRAALKATLATCVEHNIPAEPWIEMTAINPLHSWAMRLQYAKQLATAQPDSPEHQARANEVAAELLDGNTFPDGFIFETTGKALEATANNELRTSLVHSFLQAVERLQARPSKEVLFQLTEIGCQYIEGRRDAEPASLDEMLAVEGLRSHISATELRLRESSTIESYKLELLLLDWRMAERMYEGVSAPELLNFLDRRIADVFAVQPADFADGSGDPALVMLRRDETLAFYIHQLVGRGDFTGAKHLLSSTTTEAIRREILELCAPNLTTYEQVRALRPDDLALMTAPELDFRFRLFEGRLTNNAEALGAIIRETVSYGWDDPDMFSVARKAFLALNALDQQHAAAVAAEVLPVLRAINCPYVHLESMSHAIIASGDTDEPVTAYREIIRQTGDDTLRFQLLWRLGSVLKKTFPVQSSEDSPRATWQETLETGDPVLRAIRKIIESFEG
jgi:hypothetical protein